MNNNFYKLKYQKYKLKYLNLSKLYGGMLALQSSQMVDKRENTKRINREQIRRAVLDAQMVYQYQERERKRKDNEMILELNKIYKEKSQTILNPLEIISISNTTYTIIPAILSRIGDESLYTNDDEIYDDVIKYFNLHKKLLNYLDRKYKNSLPTFHDNLIIDSKIDYMEVLLKNELCDPESIILYYNVKEKTEDVDSRSKKTNTNLQKLFNLDDLYLIPLNERVSSFLLYSNQLKFIFNNYVLEFHEDVDDINYYDKWKDSFVGWKEELSTYTIETQIEIIEYVYDKEIEMILNDFNIMKYRFYLKLPYSGSNNCSKLTSYSDIGDNTTIYNILINKLIKGDRFDSYYIDCLGIYKGLIIQPINPNFLKFGEKKCFCYKGDIKVITAGIIFSNKIFNSSYIIHRSVFKLKINKIKLKNKRMINMINKILLDNEYFYFTDAFYFKNNILDYDIPGGLNNFILEKTNIIVDSKKTYNILKKELKLDGIHYRIDFINSRVNDKYYFVNEIENINFGNGINATMTFILNLKKTIIPKLTEDDIINGITNKTISDFFTLDSFKSMREILLSFNY